MGMLGDLVGCVRLGEDGVIFVMMTLRRHHELDGTVAVFSVVLGSAYEHLLSKKVPIF